jgi:hypothetical protein
MHTDLHNHNYWYSAWQHDGSTQVCLGHGVMVAMMAKTTKGANSAMILVRCLQNPLLGSFPA